MTSRDLLEATLRRWYVMVVGALVSLGFVYVATHQPVVYWTQFNILMLGPKIPEFPNYLEDPRFTLYPVVGVIADDVNKGRRPMMTASTDTNMVGQGITRGVQVRVPNLGGQWRRDYSANHLDVQVADASPEAVTVRAGEVVEDVAEALAARQDELGIVPGMRITSIASTSDPIIYAVGGNRVRAAGAAALSGALASVALVYLLERRRRRRLSTARQG